MEDRRSRAPLSLIVGGQRHREVSDRNLARGLAAKEDWAIAETWRRFAPMVLTTAQRALGSKTEAEDVAQEVFQRIFQKAGTLRDPAQLRSFIFSFAIRVLKSELRWRKRRRWLWFSHGEADALDDRAADVESRDLLRRFNALLDRLSARDRLVFVLRRMEAMTIDETAAAMDLSISTVKRSLAHASQRVARWIEMDPGLSSIAEENRWGR
jgi:RNA polymerase sigma-70 factor (ECF subfamily)